MARKIPDCAKLRLVIDGVALQTTARLLRRGSLSTCLHQAFRDFEAEHKAQGIVGRLAGYSDTFLRRDVQIQIDLY